MVVSDVYMQNKGRENHMKLEIKNVSYQYTKDGRMILDELPPHTRDFRRELGGFTCTIKVRMV